ncbi:MAG: hypothetical protein WC784_01490 [Candidatus Shapirobacteria bacterium]|jgi:hypothetical protein
MTNLLLAAVNLGDTPLGTGKSISQTYTDPATLVTIIVRNGLTIAGIILLVLLVAGGFMMIVGAGSGDQKKAATAKTMITDAAIGFLVIFLSYFIIQIVEVITGISIL